MSSLAWGGARIKAWQLLAIFMLAGCQALTGGDAVPTLVAEMSMAAEERAAIGAAATADQSMAVATIVAAGTRAAALSAVNMALGATMRANYTPTPSLQVVIVDAEDMGGALDGAIMHDAAADSALPPMQVSQMAMAAGIDPATGCASGPADSFAVSSDRVYLTAQVRNLRAGSLFETRWLYANSEVYRVAWTAARDKDLECLWFYATPADFDFTPGGYTALLLVDGRQVGSAAFTIGD